MRGPKRVEEQRSQITPELADEKTQVMALFTFGQKTPEYVAAAKNLNQKLRAAGLDSLQLVEK